MTMRRMKAGFTLIEMSIVIAIIAIVGIAGMKTFLAALQEHQRHDTQAKIAAIQTALYNYRLAYNRLPCPADATYTVGSQYYGVEAGTPGTCSGNSAPTPNANFVNTDGTPVDDVEGMIPTKTLRLPDDYAVDGWGRKIMYAVSKDLTQNYAFYLVAANLLDARMTILDDTDAAKTTLAAYVLISFGPNGHGAYPRGSGTRFSAGSVNTDEKQNCHCGSDASTLALDETFVQKMPTQNASNPLDTFDDVVVYATRSDLRSSTE